LETATGDSYRILVVDDFGPWKTYLTAKLSENPTFQVVGLASYGLEAALKAAELRPDLTLMDISLPKLNGIEAARRIRTLSPDAKILFLSQDVDPDVVRAALGAGGLGYVVKSDAESELFQAMESVMLGTGFVSSQLRGHDFTDFIDAKPAVPGPLNQSIEPTSALLSQSRIFDHRHEIAFYGDDASFLDRCTRFIGAGLAAGNAVIVTATPSDRNNLRRRLESEGHDVVEAIARGRYFALEPAEFLSTFMVNRLVDADRFAKAARSLIETALKAATGKHPRVSACGGSAPLLYAHGNATAAVQLEKLWDEITREYDVESLCGYPIEGFRDDEMSPFYHQLCAEHSAVYSR
jgi:DNA-binding NarL/FixJ family response regulator